MAREHIVLDTEVYPMPEPVIQLRWEEPKNIRSANRSGIIGIPSKSSIDLMLKDMHVAEWFEIPLHVPDMPNDYRDHWRASWLIKV
jgi:hypothetical protein